MSGGSNHNDSAAGLFSEREAPRAGFQPAKPAPTSPPPLNVATSSASTRTPPRDPPVPAKGGTPSAPAAAATPQAKRQSSSPSPPARRVDDDGTSEGAVFTAATTESDERDSLLRDQGSEAGSESDPDQDTIPRVLLLRHRMGYSTVALTKKQRRTFTRNDLEDFLLYKEQKYNAVNVLGRFAVFLLLVLTFSIFCLIFSVCSTDWQVVRYDGFFQGMGLFVACRERVLRQCTWRTSSFYPRTVTDTVTGEAVCSATRAWARGYIGAMWAMGILHLLGQTLALYLTIHVACRPTRNKSLTWIVWILLGCTLVGIVNCVLFCFYVRCDRRTCQARHAQGNKAACDVYYGWGYDAYIAATALHALCLVMAFAMSSYIHQIRVKAHVQLQEERRRKSVEKAAENFVHQIMGERGAAMAAERSVNGAASVNLGATVRSAASPRPPLAPSPPTAAAQPPQPRELNSVTITREGDPYKRRRRSSSEGGFTLQHTVMRSASLSNSVSMRRPGTTSFTLPPRGGVSSQNPRNNSVAGLKVSLAPSQHGSFIYASERQQTPGTARTQAHEDGNVVWRQEPVEYRQARKHRKRLQHIFDRDYDPGYLTAAELGVPIAGATDWVYDDKSDMYYSFDRNMFWDPLTGEYFNCALRTWQENPDTIVDVRDAMAYAWEDGYDYDGDGVADFGDDPEQQQQTPEDDDEEEDA